jgi:hypothetical protein
MIERFHHAIVIFDTTELAQREKRKRECSAHCTVIAQLISVYIAHFERQQQEMSPMSIVYWTFQKILFFTSFSKTKTQTVVAYLRRYQYFVHVCTYLNKL